MLHNTQVITEADIKQLTEGHTAELRAQATEKLCHKLAVFPLDADDTKLARKIVALLARDKSELVRRTLSFNLPGSKLMDANIASLLAQDITEVAVPILEFAPNIPADDLFDIILNGTDAKKRAVARRKDLKPDQIEALAEFSNLPVVLMLARNKEIHWTEVAVGIAIKRFGHESGLQIAFASRDSLPLSATESLVKHAKGDALTALTDRHTLPPGMVVDLVLRQTGQKIDLYEQASLTLHPDRLAQLASVNGLLTKKTLTRALCLGGIDFLEHGLAELSGLPYWKTRPIVRQAGPKGLTTLLRHSGLPESLGPVISGLIALNLSVRKQYQDKFILKSRLIERILTESINLERQDKLYLLERLDTYVAHEKLFSAVKSSNGTAPRSHTTQTSIFTQKSDHSNQLSQTGLVT